MANTELAGTPPPSGRRDGFYVRGWVLAVVGAVVLVGVAIAIGVAVRDHDGGDRRAFGRFGDGGGAHPLGLIILLILIALVVAGVVYLVRRLSAPGGDAKGADPNTSAEAILAERFARGEIDEADYVSRRNALRS
jgi:putative membrane protein